MGDRAFGCYGSAERRRACCFARTVLNKRLTTKHSARAVDHSLRSSRGELRAAVHASMPNERLTAEHSTRAVDCS